MIELGSTIELVLPYAGCQIIARMIEFLDEPLCVEFLSGDFLIVLSGISLCLMWLFYHSLLLLSMEWYVVRFPHCACCLADADARAGPSRTNECVKATTD